MTGAHSSNLLGVRQYSLCGQAVAFRFVAAGFHSVQCHTHIDRRTVSDKREEDRDSENRRGTWLSRMSGTACGSVAPLLSLSRKEQKATAEHQGTRNPETWPMSVHGDHEPPLISTA